MLDVSRDAEEKIREIRECLNAEGNRFRTLIGFEHIFRRLFTLFTHMEISKVYVAGLPVLYTRQISVYNL